MEMRKSRQDGKHKSHPTAMYKSVGSGSIADHNRSNSTLKHHSGVTKRISRLMQSQSASRSGLSQWGCLHHVNWREGLGQKIERKIHIEQFMVQFTMCFFYHLPATSFFLVFFYPQHRIYQKEEHTQSIQGTHRRLHTNMTNKGI